MNSEESEAGEESEEEEDGVTPSARTPSESASNRGSSAMKPLHSEKDVKVDTDDQSKLTHSKQSIGESKIDDADVESKADDDMLDFGAK